MENSISESLYIKDIELFTVFASLGVEEWYGLNTELSEKTVSENYRNEVLNSLFQKGLITFEKGDAMMTKQFSEIVENLMLSKSFLYIRRLQNDIPALVFYLSDKKAVCVERSVNDENTLKISLYDNDDLIAYLFEECFEEDIIPSEENDVSETEITFSDTITEEIINDKVLVTVIERFRTKSGEMTDRLMIQDMGAYYKLIMQNKLDSKSLNNCKDNQNYIIERLFKQEDNNDTG